MDSISIKYAYGNVSLILTMESVLREAGYKSRGNRTNLYVSDINTDANTNR